MNVPLKFTDLGFPANFSGTFEQFRDACVQYLGATIDSDRLITGQIHGARPTTDIGMWQYGDLWYYFNTIKQVYYPADIGIGTKDYAVVFYADPSAPRLIHAPDKDGAMAMLEDIYEPRTTINLTGVAPVIDWNKSAVFLYRMPGKTNVTFSMINSLPGHEIYVVVVNVDNSTVKWPTPVNWETSVAPVQTFAKSGNATFSDGVTTSGQTIFYSATAKFTSADVGFTIKDPSTTSPLGIPFGATIVSQAGISCVMSAPSANSKTNLVFQIVNRFIAPRADLYRFKNVGGTIYGHQLPDYSGIIPAAPFINSEPGQPIFSPVAGSYPVGGGGSIPVTITSDTRANRIRWTIDGSDPANLANVAADTITNQVNGVITGTVATGAVPGGAAVTLKAAAFDADDVPSAVTTAAYTNNYSAPQPYFVPVAGTYYTSGVGDHYTITVKTDAPSVKMYFTTDGSAPSSSNGTLINGTAGDVDISQGTTVTLKAIAYDAQNIASPVYTGVYTNTYGTVTIPDVGVSIFGQAAPSGTYSYANGMPLAVTVASPGKDVRYTLDGTTPTYSVGTLLGFDSGTVVIPTTGAAVTFKAVGIDAYGHVSANVLTRIYTVVYNGVATPTISPVGGTYHNFPTTMAITLSVSSTGGATGMRYTINATPVTNTSPFIGSTSGIINIPQGTSVVRARGRDAYGNLSTNTASATYTNSYVAPPPTTVPTPTFSPSSGIVPITVTVTCSGTGIKFRYTKDGSTPTATIGTLVNAVSGSVGSVSSSSLPLRAVAISSTNVVSAVKTVYYEPRDPTGGV